MITIHWIWLAVIFGIGIYIGLLGAAALARHDWKDEEEEEFQLAGSYQNPEIKGEVTSDGSAYIITEGEKQIKWDANGLWYNSGDGKWKRPDNPIIEIQKEGRGKDGGK